MHAYNAGWRCGRIHACTLFFAETQTLQHPQQRAFTDYAQSKTRKRAVAYDTSKQSNHVSLHHDTVRGLSMPCMTVHVLVERKGQKSTMEEISPAPCFICSMLRDTTLCDRREAQLLRSRTYAHALFSSINIATPIENVSKFQQKKARICKM